MTISKQKNSSPLNPNAIQQMASNPLSSVWVGASAGTGKTKVLVDRLLRLLLPRQMETGDIKDGTAPEKILCLTFTKAAASEMSNRINEKLSQWTVMDDENLTKALFELTGQRPNNIMRDAARRLFAQVIDAPGGMKIMTLHSFCQSVLSRFPLEAGLMPSFKIADDRQAEAMMNDAINQLILNPTPETEIPLNHFMAELDSARFKDVLKELMYKRQRILHLLELHDGLDGLINHLYQQHNLSTETTARSLTDDYQLNEKKWRGIADTLLQGTEKTDQPNGQKIHNYLNKEINLNEYASIFLTKSGSIKADKTLVTKKIKEQNPNILSELQNEANKIFNIFETQRLLKTLHATADILRISKTIIDIYTDLKKQQSLLDYTDQITMTAKLLSGKNLPQWVLFKLDNGIDHILVDEAQDTSPQQWRIVKRIAEEFFVGMGTRQDGVTRTIFAVGDEKQSIYSFQDADPKLFLEMADYFKNLVNNAQQKWQKIDMAINFRSSPAVLNAVDYVFDNETMRQSVSLNNNPIKHIPFHSNRPGLVELWPPYELADNQMGDLFHLPTTRIPQSNPMIILCQKIADTIDGWLNEKRILPSYNRPVEAGDIMILLQSRRPMMDALIKALKGKNIPVTGTDRMTLTDQLAVKDILSVINFCLLPTDDLTLAALLKSPLIGMSEDDLFILAHDRGDKSLWQVLQDKKDQWIEIHNYLKNILKVSDQSKPFDFISHLLVQACPNHSKNGRQAFFSRLGMEVKDPLDELLSTAQSFEQSNPPGLQSFVHWLTITDTEIKRELSSSNNNQIRIMTVHGSKGLQAPIVFVPDAFKAPSGGNKSLSFHWPQSSDKPFLWGAGESGKNNAVEEIKQENKIAQNDEYYRLLYVALTRAEDELYVTGWTKKKRKDDDTSWYTHIKKSWQSHAKEFPINNQSNGLRILFEGENKKEKQEDKNIFPEINRKYYSWIDKIAPTEPSRPTPLTPSRPLVKSSPVQSPLERTTMGPFWRGSLIHKILQTLPNIEFEKREDTLQKYLKQAHLKLDTQQQKQLCREILTVIHHKDYQHLFSKESQAEVPIVGEIKVGKRLVAISGQIDRLLITKNDIWIVDYKTNRPPPSRIEDVPDDYLHQMATYYALLKNLYPHHQIYSILLWTHMPLWMALPNELLEKILDEKIT